MSRTGRPRVAFVIQRAGREVVGGAESLCYEMARRLAQRWEITVLTTCAVDYHTWADHYPPGVEHDDGFTIHRFAVRSQRVMAEFDALYTRLVMDPSSRDEATQVEWMRAQGPDCPALDAFLTEHLTDFEAVCCFGYLYATSWNAVRIAKEKSVLVPLAHEEPPIHFPMWDAWFKLPSGFILMTVEEQAVLRARFPDLPFSDPPVGMGVEAPGDLDVPAFRRRHGIDRPFVLYLGRIEPAKGCDVLLRHHLAAHGSDPSVPQLVFAGHAAMEIPEHPAVRYLGFLSAHERWEAIAACAMLVSASSLESLSLVLIEAWSLGRPTLVNARCPVSVGLSRRSGCGLWFRDADEYLAGMRRLLARDTFATGGPVFVNSYFGWKQVVEAYEERLARSIGRPPIRLTRMSINVNESNMTLAHPFDPLPDLDDSDFIKLLYKLVLRRPPEGKGLESFLVKLRDHTMSRRDIFESILASDEGKVVRMEMGHALHESRQRWIRMLPKARCIVDLGGSAHGGPEGALVAMGYPYQFEKLSIVDLPPEKRDPKYASWYAGHTEVKTVRGPVEYVYGSMTDLSRFADRSVNLVFSGQSIEHVTTIEARIVLKEVSRILAPGGYLVLDTPNGRATRLQQPEFIDPDHKVEYTIHQLMELLDSSGFVSNGSFGLNHLPESFLSGKFNPHEVIINQGVFDDAEACYLLAVRCKLKV